MKLSEFIDEAANPAQQAAIAIAMKKAGKKPKNEAEVDERFQLPQRLGTKRDRFKSLRKEEVQEEPKFTGYFKGRDRAPVGKKLVGNESINPGDRIRTQDMSRSGIVESIELYRPFNGLAVYFRTADDRLLRTPISNVMRIPQGD